MNKDSPADPISGLLESAIATHEIYKAYLQAGFTKSQALELVEAGIVAMLSRAVEDPGGSDA